MSGSREQISHADASQNRKAPPSCTVTFFRKPHITALHLEAGNGGWNVRGARWVRIPNGSMCGPIAWRNKGGRLEELCKRKKQENHVKERTVYQSTCIQIPTKVLA
jgi:hypothetical protein